MLKQYLIKSPGWAWIERFNEMKKGRGAFWAWLDHYNGRGELSKRTHLALASLKMLHYKKEQLMPFEKYPENLIRYVATLDKDT